MRLGAEATLHSTEAHSALSGGGMCGVRRAGPPVLFSLLPAHGGWPSPSVHSKAGLSPGHGVAQRCVAGLGGDTCTEKEFITAGA